MNVDGVENGIVLDHIHPGRSMRLYDLLNLHTLDCPVAILKNVPSNKYGRKDIIKIDSHIDVDLDACGFIDPRITVNIVKDGKLVEKKHLELPQRLVNIVSCRNPRCISVSERGVEQIFRLTDTKTRQYRCLYCETAAERRRELGGL